ncbi:M48 family peptidase, partial [Paracoccus panacisoli]
MAGIIALDGTEVTLCRTARARRMTLRVARRDGSVTLTLPPGVREAEALAFLTSRREWLRGALATVAPPTVAAFGAALPVEGRALVLTPAAVRRPVAEG